VLARDGFAVNALARLASRCRVDGIPFHPVTAEAELFTRWGALTIPVMTLDHTEAPPVNEMRLAPERLARESRGKQESKRRDEPGLAR
jgi:hypothetical protein